jgi:hypothetical protein
MQFNREAAFENFKRLHPALAEDVNSIVRLRPFFDEVGRRRMVPLPFPWQNADPAVQAGVDAIYRIANSHLKHEKNDLRSSTDST